MPSHTHFSALILFEVFKSNAYKFNFSSSLIGGTISIIWGIDFTGSIHIWRFNFLGSIEPPIALGLNLVNDLLL